MTVASNAQLATIVSLAGEVWESLPFEPFRPGVTIHRIVTGKPELALLKYEPGARVPLHRHTDMETIFVLSGSQSDENGTYRTGDLVINPKGSVHRVWSDDGCVVLLQWTAPVEVLSDLNDGGG
ncbi:cupin domain-containing protein [Ahrensia sp. R2A130]|uniref:cupin domain-containing protein n=1 Tax=Ahrensia sp. R2A130 TaxID=744979 RepID=UPI0001E0E045|nr:cupin domain-containing protein [Ahrensia sp. R2A130]EFL90900.1 allophanate hydrolase [Ahrensia sp. R2A130]